MLGASFVASFIMLYTNFHLTQRKHCYFVHVWSVKNCLQSCFIDLVHITPQSCRRLINSTIFLSNLITLIMLYLTISCIEFTFLSFSLFVSPKPANWSWIIWMKQHSDPKYWKRRQTVLLLRKIVCQNERQTRSTRKHSKPNVAAPRWYHSICLWNDCRCVHIRWVFLCSQWKTSDSAERLRSNQFSPSNSSFLKLPSIIYLTNLEPEAGCFD